MNILRCTHPYITNCNTSFSGTPRSFREDGYLRTDVWHQSGTGKVLPGQPQRWSISQRTACLLPKGKNILLFFFFNFVRHTHYKKKSEKFISVIFSKQLLNYDSVKMSLRGHYALWRSFNLVHGCAVHLQI